MYEITETEMDAIHELWFMSGYKAGLKDGLEDRVEKFNRDMRRLNDPRWYKPWTSNGPWYYVSMILTGAGPVALLIWFVR